MSYNFAVWEGAQPLSNAHAASEFERRCDLLVSELEGSNATPVVPAIRQLVDALEGVYSDRSDQSGAASPWVDSSLLKNASDDFFYFSVVADRVEEVGQLLMQLTEELALVAFDPQVAELMPSATSGVRTTEFDLPVAHEFAIHLEAMIEEALTAGPTFVGVVQEEATGSFVQWMAGSDGSMTIEMQGEHLQPPHRRLSSEGESEMRALGFTQDGTNWVTTYRDGLASVETASNLLAHAFCEVRKIPTGSLMSVQTFSA